MTIRFIARVVGVEEGADDCLSAGIAETEDGEGMMFVFQCALYEPDEQDIALGWDTHCVVTANQGTAYGAVNELTLHGNVLRIVLDPHDLDALGLPDPEIEAIIEADDASIEEFRNALRRILAYGSADVRPSVVHL
ncbi:Imm10 family immunity protein [Streptosporangium canum]|uniref:Imm10 family immunity protein n=1 Tax=Streptosporangium canum TaxID=324952 RepID=UPI003686A725